MGERVGEEADETDLVLRAVAAAPPVAPPQSFSGVLLARVAGHEEAARGIVDALGGRVLLADGTLTVTWTDASRAAACALALRGAISNARVALAAERGVVPSSAGGLGRARELLASPIEGGILIDEATAGQLDARFELSRHDQGGWILVRERGPAQSKSSPAGDLDTSVLDVVRWGLHFVDPRTERAYRAWHVGEAVPFTRIGMIGSVVAWTGSIVVTFVVQPAAVAHAVAGWVLGIMLPLIAFVLGASASPRLLGWMLPGTVLANCAAGVLAVGLGFQVHRMPEIAMGGATIAAYFGFTIFRLHLTQAMLAVLPYILLNQVLAVQWFVSGRMGIAAFGSYSIIPEIAFASGALACAVLDRISRQSFRQGRIIEAQREEIDRERARADVAERSRQLSEALLRLGGAPRAAAPLAPGDLVEGRYRVVRAIGAGGMGQVHEVERLEDGRRLALKVLTNATDRAALARFAREAQIAAELHHPNVVPALDVGVTGNGTLFFVMELVTGSSLAAERARYSDARWALPILRQIAEALAALHARGIVHRDLKPSNVLLHGETARIADFGLAVVRADRATPVDASAETEQLEGLTRTGAIMGTPAYMAPEQGRGREVGPAADLFSLGVIAYQLLANRMPHAVPPVFARQAAQQAPPSLSLAELRSDLPTALTGLLDACLADTPERRPTAAALAIALR